MERSENMTDEEKMMKELIFDNWEEVELLSKAKGIELEELPELTPEDVEIFKMFCDFTKLHSNKLKDVLTIGFSVWREEQLGKRLLQNNDGDEKLQDAMIRAARNAKFSRSKAKEEFQGKGILRIYNLGMKHMYDYLFHKKDNEITSDETEIWSWNETCSDDWTHGTFSSREEAIEDALATKKAYNITDKFIKCFAR